MRQWVDPAGRGYALSPIVKRILMLVDYPYLFNGGVSRVVLDTCRGLQRRGYEIGMAHHMPGDRVELDCPSWKLPDLSTRGPETEADLVVALDKALEEFRPELLQSHTKQANGILDRIVERTAMCQFLHDQSYFCGGGHRMLRGYRPCHRAHGPLCLVYNYLLGCGGKRPSNNWEWWKAAESFTPMKRHPGIRLQVASRLMREGLLENGYPVDRIDLIPLSSEPATLSDRSEPGRILVPGRLAREKGVHLALEAVARLGGRRWTLSMPGPGPERAALLHRAAELGIADRVELPGELGAEAMELEYARCDFVVFPVLRHEPFGLVGTEALAHGKPVVAFGGGGVEEWLFDGESGLRVPERTPEALSGAVQRLLEDRALRDRLAAGAQRHYPKFHPDRYLDRLEESYGKTLAGWKRGRAGT